MRGDDMAGLSSVFMRPKKLGTPLMRASDPPGVWVLNFDSSQGGGAGGQQVYDFGTQYNYYGNGGSLMGYVYTVFVAGTIELQGGNGGSGGSGVINGRGTSGKACTVLDARDGTLVASIPGGGGGDGLGRADGSWSRYYDQRKVDPQALDGRGWGFELRDSGGVILIRGNGGYGSSSGGPGWPATQLATRFLIG